MPRGEEKLHTGSKDNKESDGGKNQRRESEPEQADPEFVADYLQKLRVAESSAGSSLNGR